MRTRKTSNTDTLHAVTHLLGMSFEDRLLLRKISYFIISIPSQILSKTVSLEIGSIDTPWYKNMPVVFVRI